MDKETGRKAPLTPNTQRPLPPEINISHANGALYGMVEPKHIVQMTTNIDDQIHSCTASQKGEWVIRGNGPPRWFTIYNVWSRDPVTGAESDKIRYVYQGRNGQLTDLYIGRTAAFGRARAGVEISALGPAGQLLGKAFVFGEDGPWSIRFSETLNPGEKICIVAKRPNGCHELPVFEKAREFSVEEMNVDGIAGSGATAGELILFSDADNDEPIARTTATEKGVWSATFADPLETGTRVRIQRAQEVKAEPESITVAVLKKNCLSPVIAMASGSQVTGMASPGLQVNYQQIRNNLPIVTETVVADGSASWMSTELDLKPGDAVIATTSNEDGTQASQLYSSVVVDNPRPGMPYVAVVRADGADGFANPGDYIVASAAERGVISWVKTASDGSWTLDWIPQPAWTAETLLVQFTAYTSLIGRGAGSPSSLFAMRSTNDEDDSPAMPYITSYVTPTFGGTEATNGCSVTVVDCNQMGAAVGPNSLPVQGGQWTVTARQPAPQNGELCYAYATAKLEDGSLGPTSDWSPPYVIG